MPTLTKTSPKKAAPTNGKTRSTQDYKVKDMSLAVPFYDKLLPSWALMRRRWTMRSLLTGWLVVALSVELVNGITGFFSDYKEAFFVVLIAHLILVHEVIIEPHAIFSWPRPANKAVVAARNERHRDRPRTGT